jgi:hypothetical protein
MDLVEPACDLFSLSYTSHMSHAEASAAMRCIDISCGIEKHSSEVLTEVSVTAGGFAAVAEDDLVTMQYKSCMLENPGSHEDSSQALNAVIEIAERAQVSNAAMRITGILVYNEATREVTQILEGPRDNVLKLLDCIRQDPRHHVDSAQDMSISGIDHRSFGKWNMSLITVRQASSRRSKPFTQPDADSVDEQPRSPSTASPPPSNLPHRKMLPNPIGTEEDYL